MDYFIGIDIGGTNLRACILDSEYTIIDKFKIKNDVRMGPKINLSTMCDKIKRKWENYNIKSIGVGCPGPLDLKNGIILNPPNLLGWENFKIKEYLSDELKLPVAVNNDANLAGLSEAKIGAGKGTESLYYITLSTGVGGGFIYRGCIVNGFNNIAAELNNMIINEDAYQHSGLNKGGLEGQCSGLNIARIASEKMGHPLTTKDVFENAKNKNTLCEEVLKNWTKNIAKAIANIAVVVDPEIIVLGGSVILNNPSYLEKIKSEVSELVFKNVKINIKLAKIGDDTGLIGSGILASDLIKEKIKA